VQEFAGHGSAVVSASEDVPSLGWVMGIPHRLPVLAFLGFGGPDRGNSVA
jgi:hypothetical protein